MDPPPPLKEPQTRGCLKLNDKIYPVFDGLNTVGRNPDAVINIKNLNVSKTHAIITVCNEDIHYLSDFKSSNGTVLNSKKLIPLKLYKLGNGASIKFGDVFCTYKKLESGEVVTKAADESQMFSENFYGTSTQEVDSRLVPDGINFNEMPTQIFSAKEMCINEMPTQIFEYNAVNNDSSNDSIDFMTMQKATESQMVHISEVSENVEIPAAGNSSEIAPVDINSEHVIGSEPAAETPTSSQIKPVKASRRNVIESDSSDTEEYFPNEASKSKYDISDDSETDIEDEAPETGTKPQEDEKHTEEGKKTDEATTEQSEVQKLENIDENNEVDMKNEEQTREDNTEELVPKEIGELDENQEETKEERKNEKMASSFTTEANAEELDLNQPDRIDGKLNENAEEKMGNQEQNKVGTNKEDPKSDSDTDIEADAYFSNQLIEPIDVAVTAVKKTENEDNNRQSPTIEENDVFDAPTQQVELHFIGEERKEETAEEQKIQNEDGIEENEFIFDAPTQKHDFHFISEERKEEKAEEQKTQNKDEIKENEFIFDAPTQQLDLHLIAQEQKKNNEEISLPSTSKTAEDDDDLYLQPTQTMDILSSSTRENEDHFAEDEEIFLQPTQVLLNSPVKPKSSQFSHERTKSFLTKEEEDMFLLPTQQLEDLQRDEETTSEIEPQNEQSLSASLQHEGFEDLDSTQNLESMLNDDQDLPKATVNEKSSILEEGTNEAESSKQDKSPIAEENINEDEDLSPTQNLELMHQGIEQPEALLTDKPLSSVDAKDEEMLLPPTQALERLLDDDKPEEKSSNFQVFKTPSPVKVRKPPKAEKSLIEDDDSFILQPTQALEVMHQHEEHFHKVEDQMHDLFASQSLLCTQQLVDVLETSRNEDIIDDSMLQESSFRSFKKNEPLSEESVKEILSGGKNEDEQRKEDDLVVRKSLEESAVKTYSRKRNSRSVRDDETEDQHEEVIEDMAKQIQEKRRPGRKQNLSETVRIDDKEETGRNTRTKTAQDRKKADEVKEEKKTRNTRSKNTQNSDELKDEKNENKDKKSLNTPKKTAEKKDTSDEVEDQKEEKETRNMRRKNTENLQEQKGEKNGNADKKGLNTVEEQDTRDEVEKQKEEKKVRNTRKKNTEIADNLKEENNEDDGNQTRSKRRPGRKQNLSESVRIDEAGTSAKEEKKGRSTRKKNSENSEENQQKLPSIEENKENKRGTRRKNNVLTSSDQNSESSEDKNEEIESVKSRKNSQKESSQSSTEEKKGIGRSQNQVEPKDEGVRKSKRRNINLEEKQESILKNDKFNETNSGEEDSQGSSRRTSKRKKTESDKTEETPSKKKAVKEESTAESSIKLTPRKRTLRVASHNSEDDFEVKVPRIESLKKTPVKRTLKSIKEKEDENEDTPSTSKNLARQRRLSANSKREQKEAMASTSVLATPERSRRVTKPKVAFTMMDSPELESVIRQLGGLVVDTVESCTVLVTQSVKRSQKLLCAVAQAKPVCSPQWLYECKKAHAFVDPWDYILVDKEAESKWKFSLRESLNRASKGKLLENYTFQLMVTTAADVLKGAIEACGGKCVTRNLPKCETDHLIIVSTGNNKSKYNKVVQQNPKIQVVEAEAIFDGTLRQDFHFDKFILK